MLIALLIGAITGWLLAMPIGPINATVISRTLGRRGREAFAISIGAALMDVVYCGGSAQIHQFLVESPIINLLFEVSGFVVLVWLGVRQLMLKPLAEVQQSSTAEAEGRPGDRIAVAAMERMHLRKRGLLGAFVLGVALYATNVLAIPEWIIIAGLWRSWGLLGVGVDINAFFALGAGVGTAAWYVVLIRWIGKRNRNFQPSTLKKIDFGMGIAMLVFGCYFGYQIICGTSWRDVVKHAKADTEYIRQ